jgi:PAS domain S-box-containing protein
VYWNDGAERLFGYSSSDALGSSVDALIVPHGHIDDLEQHRREALSTGFSTFETARLRKDGSLVYTVVSNKAIYDAEGRAEFIVITQKDITHIKVLRDAKLVESQYRVKSEFEKGSRFGVILPLAIKDEKGGER